MSGKNSKGNKGEPNDDGRSPYLYQNPLLNPTNGIKSLDSSPPNTSETFWPEFNTSYDFPVIPVKKPHLPNPFTRIPKKPNGWSTFVDHKTFIETMFHNARPGNDQEEGLARLDGNVFKSTLKVRNLDVRVQKHKSNNALTRPGSVSAQIAKPLILESPWGNPRVFGSKTSSRNQITPASTKASSNFQFGNSPNLPRRVTGSNTNQCSTVTKHKMQLLPPVNIVPNKMTSTFLKPKALPLPVHNKKITPGPSALEKAKVKLEKRSPVYVQSLPPFNSRFKPRNIEQKTSMSKPISQPKLREQFTQNQPNQYRNARKSGISVLNLSLPNPTLPHRHSFHLPPTGGSQFAVRPAPSKSTNSLRGQQEVKENSKTFKLKLKKPEGPKIRPAMLFPFHVPGPKHDNIYISKYQGSDDSDSEPEPETTSAKKQE